MKKLKKRVALFLCLLRGRICFAKGLDFGRGQSYHTDNKKHLGCGVRAAFGVFCLTTVHPTSTHGAHGNSGGKSAGTHVFPSGKWRKRLKMSGKWYSGKVWEQDVAGSNPVIPTKEEMHRIAVRFFFG